MEEIKVRWKKAALENCTGVPCVVSPSFSCGTSSITDIDNNSYNTVLIGSQCWTKENLKVTRYNDGTPIELNNTYTSGVVSTYWRDLRTGAYSIYDNQTSTDVNATRYGFLYNWYAAAGIISIGGMSTKNICPDGWHVPTDAEWTILENGLGGLIGAGTKMKSVSSLWNVASTPSPGTNTSGFTALPGGRRSNNGTFTNIGDRAFFWSTTENTPGPGGTAMYRELNHDDGDVNRVDNAFSSRGASIRCLKD